MGENIKLLYSSFGGRGSQNNTFGKTFIELSGTSERLCLASGYYSNDFTLFWRNNIEKLPFADIVIGMHAFEGFTQPSFNALKELGDLLTQKKKGNIYISTKVPFHGKTYTFWQEGRLFSGIVGSSNLSRIAPNDREIYEVDLLVSGGEILQKLSNIQLQLIKDSCINIHNYHNPNIVNRGVLDNEGDVRKVTSDKLNEVRDNLKEPKFDIPLKDTPKSGLNIYFGKGRENRKTHLVTPRPWYEAELIVPKSITEREGYPKKNDHEQFTVITDDGYEFECRTQGDYSKNFRSAKSLSILGKWIKGRLERSGSLKVGERVVKETFRKYGRDFITLQATNEDNIWYLNFHPLD